MEENVYYIADELLVKYLLDEATPEERSQVEHWMGENESHIKYYQHFELLWKESKRLASTSTVDENIAWERFQKRIGARSQAPVRTLATAPWMRVAALFLIIVGAALLAYLFFPPKPVETMMVQTGSRTLADTLPDGSVVTLNKNSVLRYPEEFLDSVRSVSLEGEAFFNVSANKDQPFVIRVNEVQIRVVGTSFNVKSSGGNTEVIVETGKVQVIKDKEAVTLTKNEKIIVQQRDSVLRKDEVEDKLYNYYRTKEFVCEATPLWKLVQVLNEAYDANIIIENKNIRSLPLTTTFRNESLDNILDIVSATFSITVEKSENKIILK